MSSVMSRSLLSPSQRGGTTAYMSPIQSHPRQQADRPGRTNSAGSSFVRRRLTKVRSELSIFSGPDTRLLRFVTSSCVRKVPGCMGLSILRTSMEGFALCGSRWLITEPTEYRAGCITNLEPPTPPPNVTRLATGKVLCCSLSVTVYWRCRQASLGRSASLWPLLCPSEPCSES